MVNRVIVMFEQPEYSALLKAALAELRDPPSQARHIIRCELKRRGLLPADDQHSEILAEKDDNDDN